VLADEPTGNLDSTSGEVILDLLVEVVAQERCALVLVTHDESAASRADRTVHLRDGRLETGPPARQRRRVLRAAATASR
jgi:ABC-type lipoprotein export system ATPase subunit